MAYQQMDWIERGLIGSSALNAKIARARLLDRRGRIYLAQGRLDEALEDATRIFTDVGHQRHVLRTEQHLFALAMHETGRPGYAFDGWIRLIPLADKLGVLFQSRLLRLLKASLLSELGRIDQSEQLIENVAQMCSQQPLSKDVHLDLFRGRLFAARGDLQKAISHWESSQSWAHQIAFPDVFFQSFLHKEWAKLLLCGLDMNDESRKVRQGVIHEVRSQLEEKAFEHNQARFAGELRLLLALALLLEDWMEEAYSRLADAKQWFTHHPQHPLHAERIVVELIFLQKELTNKIRMEEQAINIQNIKINLKDKQGKNWRTVETRSWILLRPFQRNKHSAILQTSSC